MKNRVVVRQAGKVVSDTTVEVKPGEIPAMPGILPGTYSVEVTEIKEPVVPDFVGRRFVVRDGKAPFVIVPEYTDVSEHRSRAEGIDPVYFRTLYLTGKSFIVSKDDIEYNIRRGSWVADGTAPLPKRVRHVASNSEFDIVHRLTDDIVHKAGKPLGMVDGTDRPWVPYERCLEGGMNFRVKISEHETTVDAVDAVAAMKAAFKEATVEVEDVTKPAYTDLVYTIVKADAPQGRRLAVVPDVTDSIWRTDRFQFINLDTFQVTHGTLRYIRNCIETGRWSIERTLCILGIERSI